MNPYAAQYRNPVDLAITAALVLAWLAVGGLVLGAAGPSESRLFWSLQRGFVRAFLWLCACIAANSLWAVVGVMLNIHSVLWFIWELPYLTSVICVFQVMPILAIALIAWETAAVRRSGGRMRTVLRSSACVSFGLGADAGLYFLLNFILCAKER
ncbi:MAG TPA: hypothetical protein VL992_01705 [Tepidisphaeraceae bacterium]|nr:hypothetical protein [Tepidisphaeraceae bacterium]